MLATEGTVRSKAQSREGQCTIRSRPDTVCRIVQYQLTSGCIPVSPTVPPASTPQSVRLRASLLARPRADIVSQDRRPPPRPLAQSVRGVRGYALTVRRPQDRSAARAGTEKQ